MNRCPNVARLSWSDPTMTQCTLQEGHKGRCDDRDEPICDDIDIVIESLALNGEYEEAARLKKATSNVQSVSTHPWSQSFSAFAISNCILDVIDEGYVVNGHRFGWLFDGEKEDFANSQRLDFRDLVLAKLRKRSV